MAASLRWRDPARQAAFGGIVGPLVFVGGWLVNGAITEHYSPINDPISDLAGVHAPTRLAMTAAFLVFSCGMAAHAFALRRAMSGPSWIAAAVTGLATVGVAALPLHHSSTVDTAHGVCAGVGYASLAATSLLAVVPLAQSGEHRWARGALLSGVATAGALACTVVAPHHGLFQRVGLTIGDCWVIASALAITQRAWPIVGPAASTAGGR